VFRSDRCVDLHYILLSQFSFGLVYLILRVTLLQELNKLMAVSCRGFQRKRLDMSDSWVGNDLNMRVRTEICSSFSKHQISPAHQGKCTRVAQLVKWWLRDWRPGFDSRKKRESYSPLCPDRLKSGVLSDGYRGIPTMWQGGRNVKLTNGIHTVRGALPLRSLHAFVTLSRDKLIWLWGHFTEFIECTWTSRLGSANTVICKLK
jgi:hypothetical protein